ncbi:hypothetical protein BCR35DRAFT_304030 [Leucosporidium creatinivorum]|uniref:Spo12 family-domain-containing protein n=1 Tax=Leucosporidium creatinivorum TaxID=106004 RepID=A0A1Y2FD55_9BASI|nr:hypothetical protein BCR35DRAFT_304030 [Leucosporidium creatinivorum]
MSAPTINVSTASPSSSSNPQVESMHVAPSEQAQLPQGSGVEQGHGKMHLGAKGFLMKKMAAGGQSFCSPTDTMVSPCTKKLVQSKQRHYTKGKPLSLSSSFQSSQAGSQLVPGNKPSGLGQQSSVADQNAPLGL